MPGPGGGAHGGGGHRGGSSGHHSYGSRPSYGGMHRGGWFYRPRFYGGGCLSGLFLPVILILCVINLLFSIVGFSFSSLSQGAAVKYDENKFQDYADSQYASEFGNSTAYEDNLLLVFLVDDEKYYDYYYIAWVGDHINTNINYMFGNENTEFGRAIASSINTNSYKYSLDSNIAQVIETMENQIVSKELSSSFTCDETHVQVKSHLTNKTDLELTEETVNSALESFTDTTGIPVVVVVEDITDVFSKQMPTQSIIAIIISIALIALVIYLISRSVRNRNKI